jgi:protein O-mannosyl-transferase
MAWAKDWMMLPFMLLLSLALYWNARLHPLVFDDITYLQENPLLTEVQSYAYPVYLSEFLSSAVKRELDPDMAVSLARRPLTYLSFYLNWRMDGWNPVGFRWVNNALHGMNAGLLYFLLLRVLHDCGWSLSVRRSSAAICALLFLAHPLATQTAGYIAQRFTCLATFFYLATTLLYLKALSIESPALRRKWKITACGLLLLGVMSKECPATAPVILVLYDCLLLRRKWWVCVKDILPMFGATLLVPVMVLLIALHQQKDGLALTELLNVDGLKDMRIEPVDYLRSQLVVLWSYVHSLIWPVGLCADPWPLLYREWGDVRVIAAVCGWLAVLVVALLFLWRSSYAASSRAALLGLAWFGVTIAPSSSFFVLPDLMAEHRCYLPSVGFFILLSLLLAAWAQKKGKTVVVLGLGVTAVLAGLTQERLSLGSDLRVYWQDVVQKYPLNYRAWSNLGAAYGRAGDIQTSAKATAEAVKLEPRYYFAIRNQALNLLRLQRYQDALTVIQQHMMLSPSGAITTELSLLAAYALSGIGEKNKSIQLIQEVLKVKPDLNDAHINLCNILLEEKRYTEAIPHLRWIAAHSTTPQMQSDAQRVLAKLSPTRGESPDVAAQE